MKSGNSLAILIPTIVGREWYYNRLIDILYPQTREHKNVKIFTLKDDKELSIGEKRNILTENAYKEGYSHRAFIDDDDTVTSDYLDLNMPGVLGDYDCNSLIGIYSVNGYIDPKKHIFIHSLDYSCWYEDDEKYYRNPNHLNVVKIDLIKDVKFQHKNFGEDGCWSEDIQKLGCLKNEYRIDKPFYNYEFRTKVNGI